MGTMSNEVSYGAVARTPEQTEQLAAALAGHLRAGDVVMLDGDLGAGKTRFVQGVAAALGIEGDVTSPTFNILLTYNDGGLELNHFDLYRLDDAEQLEDIGYFDVLEGGGASFVEWGAKFPDDLPDDYLQLQFSVQDGGARIIEAEAHGRRAAELLAAWQRDWPEGLASEGGSRHVG